MVHRLQKWMQILPPAKEKNPTHPNFWLTNDDRRQGGQTGCEKAGL
jgi:hypothetical protein